jgi:hypothetical protein
LGTSQTIEELGQQPLQLGLAVGGAGQKGATAGAQLLSSGLSQAATTQQAAAQAASGQLTGFMNNMLNAAIGSYGGGGGSMGSLFVGPGGGGGGFTASNLNYLAQPGRQQIGYTPF